MPELAIDTTAPAVDLPRLIGCDGVTPSAGQQPHGRFPQAAHLHRLVAVRRRPNAQLPKLRAGVDGSDESYLSPLACSLHNGPHARLSRASCKGHLETCSLDSN